MSIASCATPRPSVLDRDVLSALDAMAGSVRRYLQPGHGARRRRSLRRRSGIAYTGAAIGSTFAVPVVTFGDRLDLLALSFAVIAVGACVLVGPAARFVVTPAHLHIDTALHRISVPRHLIGQFERSGTEIRLRLTNGDFTDIRVDSPIWDLHDGRNWRLNSRCQVRTAARLAAMLRTVPAAPAPAVVSSPAGEPARSSFAIKENGRQ